MKSPKIKLLSDRIMVLPIEEEKVLPSGLILPKGVGSTDPPPFLATVIAIGDDLQEDLKPGDVVYVRGNEGWELNLEDEDYLVLRETAILAVDHKAAIDPFKAIKLVEDLANWGIMDKSPQEWKSLVVKAKALIYPKS